VGEGWKITIHRPSGEIDTCLPEGKISGVGKIRGVTAEKIGVMLKPWLEEDEGSR